MRNEKIQTAARALNRAGYVSINPPAGFVEDVCPALWKANPHLRSAFIRPDCPLRTKRLAAALFAASKRFDRFADVAGHRLPADQSAELKDIATDLNAAGLALCRNG